MRVRARNACWLLGLTIGTLLACPASSGKEPSTSGHDETLLPVVDLATHGGTGKALEGMRHSVEQAKRVQDELRAKLAGSLNGEPSSVRRAGRKLLEESREVSAEHAREIGWIRKLEKLTKIVDVASTGARGRPTRWPSPQARPSGLPEQPGGEADRDPAEHRRRPAHARASSAAAAATTSRA